MLELISFTIIITAFFSFLNARYLKLVPGIGVMIIAILVSLVLTISGAIGVLPESTLNNISSLVSSIDFNYLVINGLLGILLFAAAIHIQIEDLMKQKHVIFLMATIGLIVSVAIVGGGVYILSGLFGMQIPFAWAMLFGALISPTDPIAVLAIFRSVGAPKTQEIKLAGESLFNDGLAIVIFTVILGIATGTSEATTQSVYGLFMQEVFGGAILGVVLGYVATYMISKIDQYDVEILITIALVFAIYLTSHYLHVSNPIAAVMAGLLLGNHGKNFAMKQKTIDHLDNFWHLIDEMLNSILFVLLGLVLITLSFTFGGLALAVAAVAIVLFARFVGISILVKALKPIKEFSPHPIKILTWAGLRGGISVAMALSLPESEYREIILIMTYVVVVFSIVVQGLTLGTLINKYKN